MVLKWVEGDLLETEADVICHQCNCKTTHARGLAQAIFSAYPSCDIYRSIAPKERVVGTCVLTAPAEKDAKFGRIGHLFAQDRPGKCREKSSGAQGAFAAHQGLTETSQKREEWFARALSHLEESVSKSATLAFPHLIGCGLAGGDWKRYLQLLTDLSLRRDGHVLVVKMPDGNERAHSKKGIKQRESPPAALSKQPAHRGRVQANSKKRGGEKCEQRDGKQAKINTFFPNN
uniref:Macro domain-containing protein n=1 Tax=Palpitomonas bilix TaxID=652834 RepID=A0A7S3D223_9EUKA|mmetsp:Transcript_16756/g.42070  ORF Transcript_16756/g.42070 Transcript_16756/m.42070 type:complete len:232 (+) Transcript_16756:192-887(+)